jgi:ribosomal protein S6
MRSYELVFIVDPELEGDDLTAVVERVTSLVERNSGKVAQVEPWGLRRPQGVAGLERDLLLVEPVMRHLTVRLE